MFFLWICDSFCWSKCCQQHQKISETSKHRNVSYTSVHRESLLTCPDQTRERPQHHSRILSLRRKPGSCQCRTWGTPARPGDNTESRAASCECRACRSRRCERVVPVSAPWRCRTHRRVPPTITQFNSTLQCTATVSRKGQLWDVGSHYAGVGDGKERHVRNNVS